MNHSPPELSLLIKNLITSSEVQEEMYFGGDKETRNPKTAVQEQTSAADRAWL